MIRLPLFVFADNADIALLHLPTNLPTQIFLPALAESSDKNNKPNFSTHTCKTGDINYEQLFLSTPA